MFVLVPDDANDPWYCPVKLMEDYVYFGAAIGVDMLVGYLFTKIGNACRQDMERLSIRILTLGSDSTCKGQEWTTVAKDI